ncbi:MAG: hypothetical protein QNK37_36000 [Acidobacteriota bacterium]|nr:hypothetical protein [Acidobacteriota bacterium]
MSSNDSLFDRVWIMFRGNAPPKDEVEAAARLAAALRAELCGLYLEDDDLNRLADLPFVTQITNTGSRLNLNARDLARYFRVLRRTIENMLDQAASGAGLSWSFDTRTGALRELLDALHEREVLFLGPPPGPPRLGPWRATRRVGPASVLTIYDGSAASNRALDMATRIATHEGLELVICLNAEDLDTEHRLQELAAEKLTGAEMPIHYRTLHPPLIEQLTRIRREEGASRIILGLGDGLPDPDKLCETIPCSVVLVR